MTTLKRHREAIGSWAGMGKGTGNTGTVVSRINFRIACKLRGSDRFAETINWVACLPTGYLYLKAMKKMNALSNLALGVASQHKLKLGNTPAGREWCMKALSPSYEGRVEGLPDGRAKAGLLMEFNKTLTVSFAAAAANWSADLILFSNPWTLATGRVSDGATTTYSAVLNEQLGTNTGAIRQNLYDNFEMYRMIYGSATVTLNATATTDSGIIAAAQYVLEPIVTCIDTNGSGGALTVKRLANVWKDTPKSFAALNQMPGAVVIEAREGAYMPLVQDIEKKWVRTNDMRMHINSADSAVAMSYDQYVETLPHTADTAANWPYAQASFSDDEDGTLTSQWELGNSQSTVGHISVSNLNPAASLTVKIRMGFEFTAPPNTNYSSLFRKPPVYDPIALQAYYIISQHLDLCYPAAYNDFKKLVKIIGDLASKVLPIIFPPAVPFIEPVRQIADLAAPAVDRVVDRIKARIKTRRAERKALSQPKVIAQRTK